MRIVIDTNKLQSKELEQFLRKHSSNIAILTDYVAMEIYKGDSLRSIYKSLEVVSSYPDQVVIAKSSAKACKLSGRRKSLQKRIVDRNQTSGFREYLKLVQLAQNGNIEIQEELIQKGREADTYLSEMEMEAAGMKNAIREMANEFTKSEKEIIRSEKDVTPEIAEKIVAATSDIAKWFVIDSRYIQKLPPAREVPNSFFFRYCLCCYLLSITRESEGGVADVKPSKLRNDFVDMGIITFGTFSDGVLSSDVRLLKIYKRACTILYVFLDAVIPSIQRR